MNNKVGDWVECLSDNLVNLTKANTYKVTGVTGELFEIYNDIGYVRMVRQDSTSFKLIKGSLSWGNVSITDSSDINIEPEDAVYPKYKSDVPWG